MNTDGQSALVQRYPGYFINREFSTEHRNVTKLEIESTKWNCRERSLLPLISVTRYSFSTLCSHRRSLWTRLQQRATRVYSTWLDLFILTKITRGLARHVIDRTTLRQFISPFFLFPSVFPPSFPSPPLLFSVVVVCCRPLCFSSACPRVPPPPSIIPLKRTFHASRYRFPIKPSGRCTTFKGATAHGLVIGEFRTMSGIDGTDARPFHLPRWKESGKRKNAQLVVPGARA